MEQTLSARRSFYAVYQPRFQQSHSLYESIHIWLYHPEGEGLETTIETGLVNLMFYQRPHSLSPFLA